MCLVTLLYWVLKQDTSKRHTTVTRPSYILYSSKGWQLVYLTYVLKCMQLLDANTIIQVVMLEPTVLLTLILCPL